MTTLAAITQTRRRIAIGPLAALAAVVVLTALTLALFGGRVAPYDPSQQDLLASSLGPGPSHLLGTDQLGRDVQSRTLAGARTAVLGPLAIASATVLISTALGLVAGYVGGLTDSIVSRIADVVYAVPPLLVAIVVVGVLGGGFTLGIVVLSLLNIPAGFRAIRAATLEQRPLPYIESAWVLGRSRWRIMWFHIMPNIRPVVLSTFFLAFTYGFVELSTLSFLGLGVAPGTADWGRMVAESRVLVFQNPWAAVAPLLLIVMTTVSTNLLGESLEGSFIARGKAR